MPNRLMIVDDSEAELVLLREMFEDVEPALKVWTAAGGREALSRLKSERELPQVVLLDMRMPDMNGLDVLRSLKVDARLKAIPVCIFSNGDLQQDICESYEHGAVLYFKKPTDLADLQNFAKSFRDLWFSYARRCRPA